MVSKEREGEKESSRKDRGRSQVATGRARGPYGKVGIRWQDQKVPRKTRATVTENLENSNE